MKHVGVMFGCWGLPKSFHWRNPECDQRRSSCPLVEILLFSQSHVHFHPAPFEGVHLGVEFKEYGNTNFLPLPPSLALVIPNPGCTEMFQDDRGRDVGARLPPHGVLNTPGPVNRLGIPWRSPKMSGSTVSSASHSQSTPVSEFRTLWGTTAAESQFATSKGKWVGG